MSGSSDQTKEIDLGNGFGDVAVKGNGIRVELHADGSVAAYTQKDVDIYTTGAVHVYSAAGGSGTILDKDNIVAEGRVLEVIGATPGIGDKMPDGTVYAGLSPETGKAMYATPEDAPLSYTFNQAQKYAAQLDAHGHQDWRVPSRWELSELFENRAAIGGFNVSDSYPDSLYRSSSNFSTNGAWTLRFSDGYMGFYLKDDTSSLRCVR